MRLERSDGYYLGPLCINYGIAVFTFVLPTLLLGFFGYIAIKLALLYCLHGSTITASPALPLQLELLVDDLLHLPAR